MDTVEGVTDGCRVLGVTVGTGSCNRVEDGPGELRLESTETVGRGTVGLPYRFLHLNLHPGQGGGWTL